MVIVACMHETPMITDVSINATLVGDSDDALTEKDWEQFDACERCHGHAPIDENPDGDLCCQLCHCRLPRPSS